MPTQHKTSIKEIIRDFAPSWPAVVMGTGVVPVALTLSSATLPFLKTVAQVFFILSVLLMLVILVPSLLKFIFYLSSAKEDISHPVSGNFYSTLPIALMVLAIDFILVAPKMWGEEISVVIAEVLFWIGTAGIYLIGWIVTPILFGNNEIKPTHATYGWYIPPVSQLIIPVVGLDLAHHFADTPKADAFFIISMISLGIGLVLFIFVGANVYHRYVYHELPRSKMSPTLLIGLAPTAILTIILVKMNAAVDSTTFQWAGESFAGTARVLGLINWGFSAWWFVLSLIMILHCIFKEKIPFALSWWALTFPLGAFAVSTGALNKLFGLGFFNGVLIALSGLLSAVWMIVVIRTVFIIRDGSAFRKHV